MEDLTFTHTITITEDDFITIEIYLNEYLEQSNTFKESLDKAFSDRLEDFSFAEAYVKHAIWGYHKEEILEKFKEWHKNS